MDDLPNLSYHIHQVPPAEDARSVFESLTRFPFSANHQWRAGKDFASQSEAETQMKISKQGIDQGSYDG